MPRKTKLKKGEIKELDKEIMLNDFVSGLNLTQVSEKHDIPYRTLLRYSRDGDWKSKKEVALAKVSETALVPKEVLQEEAINKTLRVLHKIATDTERSLFSGKMLEARMNIKTLVDSIDKLVRLKMHVDSGGVDKKAVHVKTENFDWNKIIEASVKAKREGKNLDEKEFLRTVIDAEVVK